jgi:hypothetical protein
MGRIRVKEILGFSVQISQIELFLSYFIFPPLIFLVDLNAMITQVFFV